MTRDKGCSGRVRASCRFLLRRASAINMCSAIIILKRLQTTRVHVGEGRTFFMRETQRGENKV